MLKALELIGFKSFADRTRFDFPPAVTVVVGPNGSGKSNVVDAIKWVLGAQSVKSLRGKEMVDVIFNGSEGRRPMNTAEVTLILDNSSRRLPMDAPEVAVTRRVYRGGEGEYLINRQPCRLRDIRELFAGTGVATEAYSVIEQGKVDILLQASPRDRRAIFEEAAGISRFKAKKVEAARRLERVEQNLLRLSDIVEEVEGRLRSVRLQAAKARRYREYTERLLQLRTQVGRADWAALTDRLESLRHDGDTLGDQRDRFAAESEAVEAEALALELRLAEQDGAIHEREAAAARIREQIVSSESSAVYERARIGELEEQIGRCRENLLALRCGAGDIKQQVESGRERLRMAEAGHVTAGEHRRAARQALESIALRLAERQQQGEQLRKLHREALRDSASLAATSEALRSQLEATLQRQQRGHARLEEFQAQESRLKQQLEHDRLALTVVETEFAVCEQAVSDLRAALQTARHRREALQGELNQLQQQLAAFQERFSVLNQLEERLEGLSDGAKRVLSESRQSAGGPFRQIKGLVADLIQADVESAELIDVALGDRAQYLVLGPGRAMLDWLVLQPNALEGRVGLLRTDLMRTDDRHAGADADADAGGRDGEAFESLDGQPGVLGRADRFVESSPEFSALVARLLGRTWLVGSLARAIELAESYGPGVAFVTRDGHWVTGEGVVAMGQRHAAGGIVSRRSELRSLVQTIDRLKPDLAAREEAIAALGGQAHEQETELRRQIAHQARLSAQVAEGRLRVASAAERIEQLQRERDTLEAELARAGEQSAAATDELRRVENRKDQVNLELETLDSQLEQASAELDELRRQQSDRQARLTECEVALARSEQQLERLRSVVLQLESDQQQRSQAISEIRAQFESLAQRQVAIERSLLQRESEIAESYWLKEAIERESAALRTSREADAVRKTALSARSKEARQAMRDLERRLLDVQLEISRIDQQRTSLVERMRDDFGIDLEPAAGAAEGDELGREEVEQEIAELRKRIQNIGNVNLDALSELEELESRFSALSGQYVDLEKAKRSLEQIIAHINADSRRLFTATFETVREHFQSLFRRLFGGGQADILLEGDADADILESGIEIVARPPGKEPRSISLLSGGEKTLTCVALLLAIFRSRPSPFCVLDEVDAALDEANIERFITVMTDFLASTQFVVVTHSKKTMTAANLLYGITMQESGVSKRVSVRFEDVHEDGTIRSEALESHAHEPADRDGTQAA